MSRPDTLANHQTRWALALAGRTKWTREAWIDRLVASNKTWSPDDLDVLWTQNREPSNYPILHTVRESVCGLEAQTRRDASVVARISAHRDTAEALTSITKYIDQTNKIDQVRSKAFRSAVDVGVGWTETYYSDDPHAERIGKRNVDAMAIWCDPCGREDDMTDYQDIFRARWLPKAWVDMRFNVQDGGGSINPTFTYDPLSHSEDYNTRFGDEPPVSKFNQGWGGDPQYGPGHGLRAPHTGMGWATQDGDALWRTDRYSDLQLLVERWYRADEWAQFVVMNDGRVIEITPETSDRCAQLLLAKQGKWVKAIARRIRCAIFIADGGLLQDVPSPYPHGQFPFTPTWAYKDEEFQPMGLVRLLRDAQRDFNMRRAHATKQVLMRQLHTEEDTFVDLAAAKAQFRKYDGVLVYNPGKLESARIVDNAGASPGMAQQNIHLMDGALSMVQNLGPVNQEALGQQTNAISGVAQESRKEQAQVALFHLFDNRNMAQQCETEQTIALVQDSYTEAMEVRITGSSSGLSYLQVNQPGDNGATITDISQGRYDVIVEEQPESATARAAKMQAIGQLFQGVQMSEAVRVKLAISMAEAQDLPAKTMELLQEVLTEAEKPVPPPQAAAPLPREQRDVRDVMTMAYKDLTDTPTQAQSQALAAFGINVQAQPAQAPQVDPSIAAKGQADLQAQQSAQAHDALQTQSQQQHDAQQAQLDREALLARTHSSNAHDALKSERQARGHLTPAERAKMDHQAFLARAAQAGQQQQTAQEGQQQAALAQQQAQNQQQLATHTASLAPAPPAGVSS